MPTPTIDEYTTKARKGVEWLDANLHFDWRARVSLERLDLHSVADCVLGQVIGGFNFALDLAVPWTGGELGPDEAIEAFLERKYQWREEQDRWTSEHGFELDHDHLERFNPGCESNEGNTFIDGEYAKLHAAWVSILTPAHV